MRELEILFAEEAQELVNDIDDWWRVHRPAAPDLFWQELEEGIALLPECRTLDTPTRTRSFVD